VTVRGGNAQFHQAVLQQLAEIQQQVGAQFFTDLARPGKKQVVVPVGPQGSQVVGYPTAYKKLRQLDDSGNTAGFAAELTSTLQTAGHDAAWLTAQLMATGLPRWDGTTDPAPIAPFQDTQTTRSKVDAWLAGAKRPDIDEMDVLMLVLAQWAANGPGVSSRIEYDYTKTALSTGPRPPAVGLFHELVHAYHNAHGSQLGREDSVKEDNGGRLYECMAVGLGPFAGHPYTENAMRASYPNVAPRPRY
jgi:hypothetical protein